MYTRSPASVCASIRRNIVLRGIILLYVCTAKGVWITTSARPVAARARVKQWLGGRGRPTRAPRRWHSGTSRRAYNIINRPRAHGFRISISRRIFRPRPSLTYKSSDSFRPAAHTRAYTGNRATVFCASSLFFFFSVHIS